MMIPLATSSTTPTLSFVTRARISKKTSKIGTAIRRIARGFIEPEDTRSARPPCTNRISHPGCDWGFGGMNFTVTLTLGASLLAIWLDTRFAGLRPKTPEQGLIHAVIGAVALIGVGTLLAFLHGIPQTIFMIVVLAAFLPALVYALLGGLWMLR